MVVDFHVHCFPEELASKAVSELAARAKIEARLEGTVTGLKRSMSEAGIDHSVVLSIATRPSQTVKINNWSAEIQGDGIVAFGSIHPDFEGWRDELRRVYELGLKGIKYHPDYQQFYVDEKRMYPVYELAFELGLIIVFHAGVDIGLPAPYYCTPERLSRLVRDFPGGRIVAAHMGGYAYWDDVEKHLAGTDIYLDTSYCLQWMENVQIKRMIKEHGYDKILFATDSPWTGQKDEIAELKALMLGCEAEEAILGGNAARLLVC